MTNTRKIVTFLLAFATAWVALYAYLQVSDRFNLPSLPKTAWGFAGFTVLALVIAAARLMWGIRIERTGGKSIFWTKLVSYALAAVALIAFGAAVMSKYTDAQQQASRPYIAVVASRKSIDFPIPKEFLQGFKSEDRLGGYLETREKRRVDINADLEDLGNPEEAARIAQDLVNDMNCILVIGNSNSTLTAITLDTFLRSSDRPAYILPIASATDIMTKASSGRHGAVLRMVPDNAMQAEAVAQIASVLTSKRRVALYVDEENPFYSVSLSRDIASQVRYAGGRVVVEQSIGPNNGLYQSLEAWRSPQNAPELIIYVGVAHHSLLLIDQLATVNIKTPIVFTDGCMVRDLLRYVTRIPNRAFVLSPVEKTKDGDNDMPTYEPIGKDAYRLAKEILERSNSTTRAGIREWLSQNKTSIGFTGAAGEYKFDPEGNNRGMKWKVYEVTKGRLVGYRP